jgi:hypothetical protein
MGKVVLDLLGTLDVHYEMRDIGQPVNLFRLGFILHFRALDFDTHVATYTSEFWIEFKMLVHGEYRVVLGFEPHIHKDHILRIQFLAETVEEPIMGGQFSLVLVLHAEKKVEVDLLQ